MRLRMFLALGVGAVATFVPAGAADAKVGPTGLTIEADQLAAPIRLGSDDGKPPGDSMYQLAERAGFYPATMGLVPDPMLDEAPTTELGATSLLLIWQVNQEGEGSGTLHQVVYPHAEGGPLTYTEPGQQFFENMVAPGGWYQAPDALLFSLEHVGVPLEALGGEWVSAPVAKSADQVSASATKAEASTVVQAGDSATANVREDSGWRPWMTGTVVLAAIGVAVTAGITLRRHRLHLKPT